MGDRTDASGGRRPADHLLPAFRDLPVSPCQGAYRDREQRLQRLAHGGRLAGQIAKYKCWKADYKRAVYLDPDQSGAECVNLVPILIRELGHAFGLAGHHDDPNRPSVMDSVIRDTQAVPTDAHADELMVILLQPIQGTAPGRMDADGLGVEIAPKP